MNRTMLMYGIVVVVIVSVTFAAINFFTNTKEKNEEANIAIQTMEREANENLENDSQSESSENSTVRNEISRIHSLLNQLVGWNGYRNIRWEDQDAIKDLLERA